MCVALTLEPTQTQHISSIRSFSFLIHVSVINVDHHQIEEHRHRRKRAREKASSVAIFLLCLYFIPYDVQYFDRVENKRTNAYSCCFVFVWTVLPVTEYHIGIMWLQFVCTNRHGGM
jgi:hypothetical protein